MNITNLYHDGTTPRQIKTLKAAKAAEMKTLTNAMKRVTAKYAKAIALAEAVRLQELEVGANAFQGRYSEQEIDRVTEVLTKNRAKSKRVSDNVLKKSIDKV